MKIEQELSNQDLFIGKALCFNKFCVIDFYCNTWHLPYHLILAELMKSWVIIGSEKKNQDLEYRSFP